MGDNPFGVVYENSFGASVVNNAKRRLNDCLDVIFTYQDDVRWSIRQARLDVDRMLVQSTEIITDMER